MAVSCHADDDGRFTTNRQAHAWKAKESRLGMHVRADRRGAQIKRAQVAKVVQNNVAPVNKGKEEMAKGSPGELKWTAWFLI